MDKVNELRAILSAFEVVFNIIPRFPWTPESFNSVSHTLATIATVAKSIEDEVKTLEGV
jgi:hypothetical protein